MCASGARSSGTVDSHPPSNPPAQRHTMITVGLKVRAMLRFQLCLHVLRAGVLQLQSAAVFSIAIAIACHSPAIAQQLCDEPEAASRGVEAAGEPEACSEIAPDLDLSMPALNEAATLTAHQDIPAVLPAGDTGAAPVPLAITSGNAGAGARASLQSLRDYNTQKAARKIEEARKAAPDALPAIKGTAGSKPAIDIWSSVDAQGFDAADSRKLKAGAGLDYVIAPAARVGVVAERSETAASEGAPLGSAVGEKVSAYVAIKALPGVSINGGTQWERDQTADPTSASANKAEKRSVVVAPRIGKAFELDGGKTIEPYLEAKREIGIEATNGSPLDAKDSAAAGFNFATPGSFAVNVSTGVEGLNTSDRPNLNSKVQLKVPLN